MKNNNIQIFRFVLFVLVLCFHCSVPFFNIGWIAVEAFFVISAYFLTAKYYDKDFVYSKETKKRVIRLSPPLSNCFNYWISLCCDCEKNTI